MYYHVVTGGTGFIGSALILELLRQTDAELFCIVRSGRQSSAQERLQKAVEAAARAYEYDERLLLDMQARCHVLPGDVTGALCCCDIAQFPKRIDQFWHCAASLQYEDRYQVQIDAINFDGTCNALELARRLRATSFNYISTAYVAGRRTGRIPEQPMPAGWSNNHYEASKVKAERAVIACSDEMQIRILRPSVVIGHSQTFGAANSFSGMYGFIRKLLQFQAALSRLQDGLLQRETIQMRVDPGAPLNLIPIDHVVDQAIRIALSETNAHYFHLTNPNPPLTADFLYLLFDELDIKRPMFVAQRNSFSWIDKKLDQGITFYSSYLVGGKHFERTNTDAALRTRPTRQVTLDDSTLRAYFRWYFKLLAQTRSVLLAHH